MASQVLAIVGPTGSGKTSLGLHLARLLNGEIISADSRQLYRYMDIGTAKPSAEELRSVRHHFIDILNPDEDYNAGRFSEDARKVITAIIQDKKLPIVVGGSGLYIEALVDGFFPGPPADLDFRELYYERLRKEGGEVLLEELRKLDPVSASKMLPSNGRRIVRAMEVFHVTGKRISELQNERDPLLHTVYFAGLRWDRKKLYHRIDRRVDSMLKDGLLDEVKQLEAKGYNRTLNALQTVGYKETFQYLYKEITRERMVELIKQNSRRYAKRQLTWFRPDQRIHWVDTGEETQFDVMAENLAEDFTLEDC